VVVRGIRHLFFVLLFATGVMGIVFVGWQFGNRGFASDFFTACANVAARWTETSPVPEKLKAVPLNVSGVAPLLVPAELVEEYRQIAGKRITPWAKYLTMGTMLLWAFAAVARVLYTAPYRA
jgi:hypothetical protein